MRESRVGGEKIEKMDLEKAVNVVLYNEALGVENWLISLGESVGLSTLAHVAFHKMNSEILFVISEDSRNISKDEAIEIMVKGNDEWLEAYYCLNNWYWRAP